MATTSRTLIFDEVDTGIGGVTASVLGERLAALAAATQIVCITHLPQVAVFADRHFVIRKLADAQADTTETVVAELSGDERLDELARMLGGGPATHRARHARALLERAPARRGLARSGPRPRAARRPILSAPRPLVYLLPEVTQGSPHKRS